MSTESPPLGRAGAVLVERLRDADSEKLLALCKMHYSVLFDLDADNFDNLFGDAKEESKGGLGFLFRKRKSSRSDYLDSPALPVGAFAPMERLIRHLFADENVSQEGLFRKPGNLARQKELKDRLGLREGTPGFVDLTSSHYSAHDCACVLKTLLGDMPEPLLTDRLYLAHCKVLELRTTSAQIKAMQLLTVMLPAENRRFLKLLLGLLHAVSQAPSSRMTFSSLGTVFAPHILCPRKLTAVELQTIAGAIQQTIAIMIEHYKDIFQVPQELALDIRKQLKHDATSTSPPGRGGAVMTALTFADRREAMATAAQDYTQVALAELYAGVNAMPDSERKKKLVKQLTRAHGYTKQAEGRHSRSKSVGSSIKNRLRKHKRQKSERSDTLCHSVANTPDSVDSFMPLAATSATTTVKESVANKVMMMPIQARRNLNSASSEVAAMQPGIFRDTPAVPQASSITSRSSRRQALALLNVSDTCINL